MNPENIVMSKKPDTRGHILHDSISMKCPEQANVQRQKAGCWLPGAGGEEEWGVTAYCGDSFWDDGKVLELDSDSGCTTL